MFTKATLTRFAEAFVTVFVVSFAADPIFSGGTTNLFGPDGLRSLVAAAVAASVLALRRAMVAA